MPIMFSVVARGTVVLAKYATCAGNFTEVTEQILSKIPPHDDKLTYSHGSYLFHYIAENKLVYFCITDDQFQRSRAFLFLNEIKRRFVSSFGDTAQTAIPYAMNSEFARVLATEMKHYSESKDLETISRVHGELDELKNIMIKNIDNMAMRGEKLELLVNKADNLATGSVSYSRSARTLQRTLFWKNIKMYVILVLIAAIAVYLIGAMACGGLAWRSCVGATILSAPIDVYTGLGGPPMKKCRHWTYNTLTGVKNVCFDTNSVSCKPTVELSMDPGPRHITILPVRRNFADDLTSPLTSYYRRTNPRTSDNRPALVAVV